MSTFSASSASALFDDVFAFSFGCAVFNFMSAALDARSRGCQHDQSSGIRAWAVAVENHHRELTNVNRPRNRDGADLEDSDSPAPASDRGIGRLAARAAGAEPAGAGSLAPDPTGRNAGDGDGDGVGGEDGERPVMLAGPQHRGEVERAGRMAGRKTRHPAASGLVEAAPGRRCATGTTVTTSLTGKEVNEAAELGPLLD